MSYAEYRPNRRQLPPHTRSKKLRKKTIDRIKIGNYPIITKEKEETISPLPDVSRENDKSSFGCNAGNRALNTGVSYSRESKKETRFPKGSEYV